MPGIEGKDFLIFYVALFVGGVIFLLWRKPRIGMTLRLGGKKTPQRDLNVIFNYNGHSWDAFEVLGLPAGSSRDRVEDAFHEACQRVEVESRPFLEAAYRAIKHHRG